MFYTVFYSPLDQFEVTSLLGFNFPLLGLSNITLTNFGLYSILILLIVVGLHIYGDNDSNLVPNK